MVADITSIVVCHNTASLLPEAVDSVLKQSLPPAMIVIIDDASDDGTKDMALEYVHKYPRLVSYCRNEKNLGTVGTYNKALGMVKTGFYSILDGDDTLVSTYFEQTLPRIRENDKIGIVYTDLKFIGPRAKIAYYSSDEEYWLDSKKYILRFPDFDKTSRKKLEVSNFIHNASLCRTEATRRAGGYKKTTGRAIDHDLFLRIVNQGYSAVHVPEPLLMYRQHAKTQFNNKNTDTAATLEQEEIQTLEKKTQDLANRLNQVKSSKFYKLWRKYCALKERFLNNKNHGAVNNELF